MQTLPRHDESSETEAARAKLEARARLWTLLAALSVLLAFNVFLGVVAAILGIAAGRAARRGEIVAAAASLRWSKLLTLLGVMLFAAAGAVAAVTHVLTRSG